MGRSEYLMIHIRIAPPNIIVNYNLNHLVDQDGWIYMKIIGGMYGKPWYCNHG